MASATQVSPLVTGLEVETQWFPPEVKPPGSAKTFFLAGAGWRGMEVDGKFVKFTTTGVYLKDEAVSWLAAKWKGKTAEELLESDEFFQDIVTGPFEKFYRLTHIRRLEGEEFSGKVGGHLAGMIKSAGAYGEAEAKAVDKFIVLYKDKEFLSVGFSNLYHQSPTGSLTVTFSDDGSYIPEERGVVIENKPLSEVMLYSIIGKNGVSPTLKRSLAERLSQLMKQKEHLY
ncbi:chalcone--flavonone isomerase [Morus notabilis]|uniref:chalcone--flavonone isomerase n=1 Tax=Morus notabilis TaxID=981085 RepID=UPI000CED01C6|nr:chalcone--flavonone isomerase [Morus notabilis]